VIVGTEDVPGAFHVHVVEVRLRLRVPVAVEELVKFLDDIERQEHRDAVDNRKDEATHSTRKLLFALPILELTAARWAAQQRVEVYRAFHIVASARRRSFNCARTVRKSDRPNVISRI
jgi:hypothetical protein